MKQLNLTILRTIILLACMAGFKFAGGAITVDSVHVTVSTCPNNGKAKVYARSTRNNAVFLFNLVSGPVTYPQQNDSTFLSLYPGTYTGYVHDVNSFDSTQFTFTITGNYQSPVVSITGSSPLCLNSNTGQIIGHVQTGSGLPPYHWQMFSPYTGPEQLSDTFNNLPQGSYIIRLTDGCNISRSVSIALDTGGTGLQVVNPGQNQYVQYIACGTAIFNGFFSVYKNKAYLPLTLTETTSTGTVTKQIYPQVYDTTYVIPPMYTITDTVYGVEFGGPFQISLTDICDTVITYEPNIFQPFEFQFVSLTDTCGNAGGSIVAQDSNGVFYGQDVFDLMPLHVTLQNAQTLQMLDSFTAVDQVILDRVCQGCPLFAPEPANENLLLTVTDGCHNISRQVCAFPPPAPASCRVVFQAVSCLDSTGQAEFFPVGFGSTLNLTFNSGPPLAGSTNPLFAYNTQLVYPVQLTGLSPYLGIILVANMPAGFYSYTLSDLCGHSITDTFTLPYVVGLNIGGLVTSNCNGTANIELVLPALQEYLYVYSIAANDTANVLIDGNNNLVVYNSAPGAYAVSVGFNNNYGTFLPGNGGCSYGIDTVVVPNYNDSIINSTYTAYCNGDIYLIILADTNNGPPPFQYEVLSGPQTFGLQSTGLFQVNAFGTYLVGAVDSCGNEDTRYVTVDTGRILPVVRSGGLCAGGTLALHEVASPYFAYKWVTPSGQVYHGSSIVINPFTGADTGLVHITQYVTVNGCTDSATGTYYLAFNDTFASTVYLCANDTFWIDTNYYTQAGVYIHNYTGVYGCDSVVITTVYMRPAIQASIFAQPVDSCNTGITQLTGNGGMFYLWQPGNINQQTIDVYGDETTYYLTVRDTGYCYATDSILVHGLPVVSLSQDFASVCNKTPAQLCAVGTAGVSYLWSNGSTTQCISTLIPGAYNVTITSALGCTAQSQEGQVVVIAPPVIQKINDTLLCMPPGPDFYNAYQWTLNGNPITGATNETYVPNQPGTYSCLVTDSAGCSIAGNNFSFVTGVAPLTGTANVWLLPNPTTGNLIIQTQNFTPKTITIYDEAGRPLSTLPFKNEIDISPLSNGVYFMEVTGTEGVVRRRVVKM